MGIFNLRSSLVLLESCSSTKNNAPPALIFLEITTPFFLFEEVLYKTIYSRPRICPFIFYFYFHLIKINFINIKYRLCYSVSFSIFSILFNISCKALYILLSILSILLPISCSIFKLLIDSNTPFAANRILFLLAIFDSTGD